MIRSLLLATAAAAVGALALPAPASAAIAALPAQDSLFQVGCSTSNGAQLDSLDPATAAATLVGPDSPDPLVCAAQGAVDPATGTAYYIAWVGSDSLLVAIDLETGESTTIDRFSEAGTGDILSGQSLAIDDDGKAYLMGGNITDASPNSNLYSLDLTTAEGTLVGPLTWGGQHAQSWYAFAYNPTDGGFYGVSSSGSIETVGLYRVDVTEGKIEMLVDRDTLPGFAYSFQFDSDGALWILGSVGNAWGLYSTSVSDYVVDFTFIGDPARNGEQSWSESLLLVRGEAPPAPPQLAATGGASAPLAIAVIALLGVGAALLLVPRPRPARR